MESRWHLTPGQASSKRENILHASNSAWKNIRAHLDQKKIAEDAIEKERAKKKWMKDTQEELRKDWKDCFQVCINGTIFFHVFRNNYYILMRLL